MFKKYTSIENTYRLEFLERIKGHGFWEMDYVVQEKAHGANLSYYTSDGITFNAAKRAGSIEAGEKFYNYDIILTRVKNKFQQIWQQLKQRHPDLQQMTIFGEIIGGNYPHKEVKKDNLSSKVQKGIYYSPENIFYAFDIMINADTYLDVNTTNALFETSELLHAKTLFQGSIEDCLSYPNDFESVIAKDLGLPVITPNVCEGTVIRPIKNAHFNNGVRVILKNKNDRWSENGKFHKTIKKEEPLSEQVIKLQEAILTYATNNRLNNVVSKIGAISQKDIGRVIGLFNKDIVEDFRKDYGELLDGLDKKEVKAINKSISKTTAKMVVVKVANEFTAL